jgi:alpha-galactosidase
MRRIAIIGAGSIIFCKTLILDILNTPGLEETEFALMAPSMNRISQVEAYVNSVIKANGLKATAFATTDRQEALKGASYVIASFQIGGITAYELDYKIPLKYGVDQCIGDSMGPGGIFRALRSIPVMLDLARDMQELCPDALLLNYVNPMAMMCGALGETGVKFAGLCHGVQTTLDLISGYIGVPKKDVDFFCAGINHMAWFLKVEAYGKDMYPILRENIEKPEYYANEKVRGEVMRHFGYMMTESTGHLSEYLPWFRSSEEAIGLYCDEPDFGGESGAYYNWCRSVEQKYKNKEILSAEGNRLPLRSVEYCSYIIEAIETGKTFRFNGNVRNNGAITNLPADCCAEIPIFADRNGLNKTIVGNLPIQLAALNMTNINVQRLGVEAAKAGDPDLAMQACALDPLTSAVLTLNKDREMASEMLEAERQWLPQFTGKSMRPAPVISIPSNVKRVSVPVDPALAIIARFGELAK